MPTAIPEMHCSKPIESRQSDAKILHSCKKGDRTASESHEKDTGGRVNCYCMWTGPVPMNSDFSRYLYSRYRLVKMKKPAESWKFYRHVHGDNLENVHYAQK